MKSKFVSIIIPVYRDWKRLTLCLDALSNQSYSHEDFEVIIINNDVEDDVPGNFFLPDNCMLLTEAKPGSYAARNAGLRIAKGEIIGFTDSDCIPRKDWIKNAVDYLGENKVCSRVAGVISIIQQTKKPTIIEAYNIIYGFPQKGLIDSGGGSVTANLFSYRYVFERVGYFDENLMSMGDKYWGMLAQVAGFQVHLVENVIVEHPPRNLTELIQKEKRHGGVVKKTFNNKIMLYLYFVYQLRPHFSALTFMFSQSKEIRIIDRISIPFLRHFLLIVRAYENLKVQLGKKPART